LHYAFCADLNLNIGFESFFICKLATLLLFTNLYHQNMTCLHMYSLFMLIKYQNNTSQLNLIFKYVSVSYQNSSFLYGITFDVTFT